MIVRQADGTTVNLGKTENAPTISMTDYSQRVTDGFGVTTVTKRGFSRKMSVRFAVASDQADGIQRRLADLRATSALWTADARYKWLTVNGFYSDFNIDLAVPPLSYCSLTVEGFAESETVADTGIDPAPDSKVSTLQVLDPIEITDSVLLSSDVPENDAPAWAAGTTYALGAKVIRSHRVFESLTAGNVGNEPTATSAAWLDTGPTNRWAMFDQALGTTTTRAASITVTLPAGQIKALALLDVAGTSVRVQAPKASGPQYDRTITVTGAAITFLDLPGVNGTATITITGSGTVSVGTLLAGRTLALGRTEAAPTAGIVDYSRKEVDDFGDVTLVKRAWSKEMSSRALIRSDAIDVVANRLATLRAQPVLWIGKSGFDVLTIYGFAKDWSIEVGQFVSKLSLTVEGLSKADAGSGLKVDWPNVGDPDGTRPDNNATVGAPAGTPVAGRPAEEVVQQIDDLFDTYGDTVAAGEYAEAAEAAKNAAQLAASNSAAARDLALGAKEGAEVARDTASARATAAIGAAEASAASSSLASAARLGAEEAAGAAQGSSTTAATRASEAKTFRDQASTSATNAQGSAATASEQAGLAAQSKDAAGASATAANTSAGVASTKAGEAGVSATAANSAKVAAETARDGAQASAGVASGQAGVASDHAAAALDYRNTTATYRDQAAGSANSANLSAQAASNTAAQVVADVGAISQRVDSVEATANGASASASQSAAAVATLDGKVASRLVFQATSPSGRAQLTIFSTSDTGAGFELVGNVAIRGDLLVTGTVSLPQLNRSTMTANTSASASGTFSAAMSNPGVTPVGGITADMPVNDGGTLYFTVNASQAASTNSSVTDAFISLQLLDTSNNVLADVKLPFATAQVGGLSNYGVRLINLWGQRTLRWRLVNRATSNAATSITNPAVQLYWSAL